ncbi:MFS general substrate transporter [Aaosphaeria arxii CBS 175.79]|uniref:MFS general substrate transporter n=1 Tax=Aaosphaeria arxii CBS 175.79 TaxID=1450172 RepID=A0A6A5Y5W3_9PLEO|nr:MFS general substrate transporter [Aaosphaeria arxii CBS 175.79]KAF2020945.1 MFS general substrate transporter [Aaosphaeria arxii CBS 175.79]
MPGLTGDTAHMNTSSRPEQKLSPNVSNELAVFRATRKATILRRRSYIGSALISFNVYGIILSFGPYLDLYYKSIHPRKPDIVQLSSIQAARLVFAFAAIYPIGYFYRQKLQRTTIWISTVGAILCQGAVIESSKWWELIVVSGSQGFFLGSLATSGILCLATHYRNNLPLTSMICTNAGFLGAITYTMISYMCVERPSKWVNAQYINISLLTPTLVIASLLLKPNPTYAHPQPLRPLPLKRYLTSRTTICFTLGYWLISTTLFVWPTTYLLLHSPSHSPSTSPLHLVLALTATYATAFISASIVTSPYVRRSVGPVNTFVAASLVAAACYLTPAWMPGNMIVLLPSTIIYGACLGPLVVLGVKVVSVFEGGGGGKEGGEEDRRTMPGFIAGVQTGAGGSAGLGVMVAAVVVRAWDEGQGGIGFRVLGSGAVVLTVVGCLLLGCARWERGGRRFRIVI